jgi:L-iditol 2-dehydrogenase
MRAGVYYSNSDLRVEERPRPLIGPGEILVRIMASGVCGSDVLEWYRIKKAPLVLGHEVAGTVAEVGAGVTAWRVGDRVAVTHHVPCNTCPACLGGHHTACATLHDELRSRRLLRVSGCPACRPIAACACPTR